MRDMLKTLERERRGESTCIPTVYQLTIDDLDTLIKYGLTADRFMNAIADSFEFGFILGKRCQRSAERRKRQKTGKA